MIIAHLAKRRIAEQRLYQDNQSPESKNQWNEKMDQTMSPQMPEFVNAKLKRKAEYDVFEDAQIGDEFFDDSLQMKVKIKSINEDSDEIIMNEGDLNMYSFDSLQRDLDEGRLTKIASKTAMDRPNETTDQRLNEGTDEVKDSKDFVQAAKISFDGKQYDAEKEKDLFGIDVYCFENDKLFYEDTKAVYDGNGNKLGEGKLLKVSKKQAATDQQRESYYSDMTYEDKLNLAYETSDRDFIQLLESENDDLINEALKENKNNYMKSVLSVKKKADYAEAPSTENCIECGKPMKEHETKNNNGLCDDCLQKMEDEVLHQNDKTGMKKKAVTKDYTKVGDIIINPQEIEFEILSTNDDGCLLRPEGDGDDIFESWTDIENEYLRK